MKKAKAVIIHFLVPLFCAVNLFGQSTSVDLYLQPDLQSEKLQTVEPNDPRLGPASPVLDETSAAIGWQYAEFNGTINGFVQDAKIGKDLFPVDNAIIYSKPSSESPVISVYHLGDELEIIDTGAWWEVRLTTSFPVYFLNNISSESTEAPLDIVEMDMEFPEEPTPTTESTLLLPNTPLPESPADITGQSYHGIFKKSKKGLGLFTPKEPFYLKDAGGGRIAWLDTTGLIGPGTLQSYLDKEVIIFGERVFDESSKAWIIHVRNMRIK